MSCYKINKTLKWHMSEKIFGRLLHANFFKSSSSAVTNQAVLTLTLRSHKALKININKYFSKLKKSLKILIMYTSEIFILIVVMFHQKDWRTCWKLLCCNINILQCPVFEAWTHKLYAKNGQLCQKYISSKNATPLEFLAFNLLIWVK